MVIRLFSDAMWNCAGGLLYVAEWNSLQHTVASAFLAAVYSDYMSTSGKTELTCSGKSFTAADLRKFAKSQVTLQCHRPSTVNTVTKQAMFRAVAIFRDDNDKSSEMKMVNLQRNSCAEHTALLTISFTPTLSRLTMSLATIR
jgi:hypothetical protein